MADEPINVVPLNGIEVVSANRDAFLAQVARTFDNYVDKHNEEPEAITYALGGIAQNMEVYWLCLARSEGSASYVKAAAAVELIRD